MKTRAATVLAIALTLWSTAAAAQRPAPCPDSTALGAASAAEDAAIVISASARAREVRFETQPQVRVSLPGCAALDSLRVLERRNLPDPVQPGVTYRDVFVAVELLGHLEIQCLLRGLAFPTRRDTTVAGTVSAPAAACASFGREETERREP